MARSARRVGLLGLAPHCGRLGDLTCFWLQSGEPPVVRGATFVLTLCVVALALVVAAFGVKEPFPAAAYQSSMQPVRADQPPELKRAIFADQRLWLMSDAGQIWTVQEGIHAAKAETLPDPVYDMCVQAGRPVIITGSRDHPVSWTVQRLTGGGWQPVATIPVHDDGIVAALCEPERLTVLTSRRLIEINGERYKSILLTRRLPTIGVSVGLPTPDGALLGLNVGEFGGGLRRIDRRTGLVTSIERRSGSPCGVPLDSACDPVTALAPESWRPGCAVAAIGLVHMSSHGRILEICGVQVRRLYAQACPGQPPRRTIRGLGPDAEPFCTEAFSGLARDGDHLVAVATDGLHAIDRRGGRQLGSFPDFETYGPFAVSFASADHVLVLTGINGRLSLSGATPLIVAR